MKNDATTKLSDGTYVRHKAKGYEGKIEGTTAIKACFTREGVLIPPSLTKDSFQYRIVIKGEAMRRIAPAEDLEIAEEKSEAPPESTPQVKKSTSAGRSKRKR